MTQMNLPTKIETDSGIQGTDQGGRGEERNGVGGGQEQT